MKNFYSNIAKETMISMLDASDHAYLLFDKNFSILGLNKNSFESILKIYQTETQIGDNILVTLNIKETSDFRNKISACFNGHKQNIKTPIKDVSGNLFYFTVTLVPIMEQENVAAILIAAKDVTKEEQVAKKYKQQIQYTNSIINSNTSVLIRTDLQGNYTYSNRKFYEYFGGTPEDLIGKPFFSTVIPEDIEVCNLAAYKCITTPGHIELVIIRKPRKDGGVYWTEWEFVCIRDEDGNPIEIQAVGRDISERKLAELALQKSEANLKAIFKHAETAYILYDKKLIVQTYNEQANTFFVQHFGTELTKGISGVDVIPDTNKDFLRNALTQALTGETTRYETSFITHHTNYWLEGFAFPITDDENNIIGVCLSLLDITLKKNAAINLEKRERILSNMSSLAKIGGYEIDFMKEEVVWSEMTKQLHGLAPHEQPNLTEAIQYYKEGEERELVRRKVESAITNGEAFEFESIIVTKQNQEKWVRAIGVPEMKDGKCIRLSGAFMDIQQEVNIRKLLEVEKDKYQRFIETLPLVTLTIDTKNLQVLYVSPQIEELLGYTPEEFIDSTLTNPLGMIAPEFKEQMISTVDMALVNKERFSVEYKAIKKNGETIWVRSIGKVVAREEGEVFQLIMKNINEDKRNRQLLQESELRFRNIAETAPVLIWMCDEYRKYSYVNKLWSDFLNKPRYTLLGSFWGELIDELDKEQTQLTFEDAFRQRKEFIVLYRIKSKGTYKWILDKGVPRYDEAKEFIGFMGSAIEVTVQIESNQKLREREIQLTQAIAERNLLIKEIHHRVKNNLQVIAGILFLKGNSIKDPTVSKILTDLRTRLRSISLIHEKLLYKDPLEKVNIGIYLETLLREIKQVSGVHPDFLDIEIDIDDYEMNLDPLTNLGFILNELFTNTIKHAFPNGEKGIITLKFKIENEVRTLYYADNGVGLPENVNLNNSNLFGLQLIKIFASHIHAKVELKSINGTQWKFTF
ncbi:MAG: PAS domain-containing sensor histidine kinase [Chryseotalea sp.]